MVSRNDRTDATGSSNVNVMNWLAPAVFSPMYGLLPLHWPFEASPYAPLYPYTALAFVDVNVMPFSWTGPAT